MSLEMLVAPLRQVALFEGLTTDQLATIAKSAERIVFRPGDAILQDGEDSGGAYLLVSGEARRISGAVGVGDIVEAGCLLSEMAMFVDTEASSTIVAKSAVRALRLDRSTMIEHMTSDPSLADYFVARISSRLREVADELRRVDATLGGQDAIDVDWSDVRTPASADAARQEAVN